MYRASLDNDCRGVMHFVKDCHEAVTVVGFLRLKARGQRTLTFRVSAQQCPARQSGYIRLSIQGANASVPLTCTVLTFDRTNVSNHPEGEKLK